jgi:hypothetical protein
MKRERARTRARCRARRRLAGAAAAGAVAGAIALPGSAAAATFQVTTNANSGPGSLRQAISDANLTTPQDTITFAPTVTSPITLTGGRIPITRSTVIDGPGAGTLKVVAPSDNAFFVNDTLPSGIKVEIEGLTMEGHSSGAGSAGGAVVIGSGTGTTIRDCVITGSSAANQGGGVAVETSALAVVDSTIKGSTAGSFGGAIYAEDATVTVAGSTLTDNKGAGGGGIAVVDGASAKPTALAVGATSISGNRATSGAGAGIAVYSADGPTSVSRSTVSGNIAADGGGGLYFGYGSSLAVDSSTFARNSAAEGGGIEVYAPSGSTSITSSTIANNTSIGAGGGIYSFGYFDKPVTIRNSTIASNISAGTGGGIFRFGYDGQGPGYEGPDEIALASTIVANNIDSSGADLADGPLADDSFRAANSIVSKTGGAVVTESSPGTNQLNTGLILLAPLADNGGPTQTMLPAADGPAIDAGTANGLAADQRGQARIFDQPAVADGPGSDGSDVGAVELGDVSLDGGTVKAKKKQKVKGRRVVVTVAAGAAEDVTASAAGTAQAGKRKLPLNGAAVDVPAGASQKLKLKPASKKGSRKILKALRAGKRVKVSLQVTLTDGSGHQQTLPAKVKLRAAK